MRWHKHIQDKTCNHVTNKSFDYSWAQQIESSSWIVSHGDKRTRPRRANPITDAHVLPVVWLVSWDAVWLEGLHLVISMNPLLPLMFLLFSSPLLCSPLLSFSFSLQLRACDLCSETRQDLKCWARLFSQDEGAVLSSEQSDMNRTWMIWIAQFLCCHHDETVLSVDSCSRCVWCCWGSHRNFNSFGRWVVMYDRRLMSCWVLMWLCCDVCVLVPYPAPKSTLTNSNHVPSPLMLEMDDMDDMAESENMLIFQRWNLKLAAPHTSHLTSHEASLDCHVKCYLFHDVSCLFCLVLV